MEEKDKIKSLDDMDDQWKEKYRETYGENWKEVVIEKDKDFFNRMLDTLFRPFASKSAKKKKENG